ncbi:MAG: SDR family oxidoreductase [Candidatus Helarchaeota archaeon]
MNIRHKIVLFTGFPGFIGTRLLQELIQRNEDIKIYALVIKSQFGRANQLIDKNTLLSNIVTPIQGDVSKYQLGLEPEFYQELTEKVTDIFHLAAIYHFEVPKKLAWNVNIRGTYNIIQFALKCKHLCCFVHFSSMVATGRKMGKVREDELDLNVSLHENHYEITKHVSEYLVRQFLDRLPVIIIRPAAVIGDSRTGETTKFDGSYPIFELGRGGRDLGKFIPRFHIKGSQIKPPMVPVDYLVKAVAFLVDQEACIGHTFHLGDFKVTVNEFLDTVFGKAPNEPRLLIPNTLVKAIMHAPFFKYLIINKLIRIFLRKGLQIPVELLQSMDSYDLGDYQIDNCKKFLEPHGITCPKFTDYAEVIFEFQRRNRKIRSLRR